MSQDELLFSEVGDGEQGLFRVIFVPEDEINNFRYGSGFIRGAVDIKDGNGFGEFKEMEPRTFSIVSVDKLSGSTTVY